MGALDQLLQRNVLWRGGALGVALDALPTGFAALDAELPGRGWPRQGLTEFLTNEEGIGELALLLPVVARLTREGKRALWLAPPHEPYAPALAAAGVDLVNLLIVRPERR